MTSTPLSLTFTLSGVEGCLYLAFIEVLTNLNNIDTRIYILEYSAKML